MTEKVHVITSVIQHMYDPNEYHEIEGVARSDERATQIKKEAEARKEVLYADIETHYLED